MKSQQQWLLLNNLMEKSGAETTFASVWKGILMKKKQRWAEFDKHLLQSQNLILAFRKKMSNHMTVNNKH